MTQESEQFEYTGYSCSKCCNFVLKYIGEIWLCECTEIYDEDDFPEYWEEE